MERRPAQRPFRIRIQIRVGAWLSQHGASDMPVETSPLLLWSELLIQIFETVAPGEYLVRWVTEQFHSAADERPGDLVGRRRTEEARVGKEGVSTGIIWGGPVNKTK